MTKKKSLKTALLMSGLSMLLCSAMLAGTTFAWFSDTAKSGENTIVAGNLHVALEYNTQLDMSQEETDWADDGNWAGASEQKLFDDSFTWEPGAMLISTPFRIKNTGDLALDYEINIECTYNSTTDGKSLKDVIQMKVVTLDGLINDGGTTPGQDNESEEALGRMDIWEAVEEATPETLEGNKSSNVFVAMLYWMPQAEQYDNVYNNAKDGEGQLLNVKCKISILAKQAASEKDSVSSDYDKDATYPEA